MAAKIDQFRKLHVIGEPFVLHNIWDSGNRSRAERTNVSFPERRRRANIAPSPLRPTERFGWKQFHIKALRTRNIEWLTRHSSEENYEK